MHTLNHSHSRFRCRYLCNHFPGFKKETDLTPRFSVSGKLDTERDLQKRGPQHTVVTPRPSHHEYPWHSVIRLRVRTTIIRLSRCLQEVMRYQHQAAGLHPMILSEMLHASLVTSPPAEMKKCRTSTIRTGSQCYHSNLQRSKFLGCYY